MNLGLMVAELGRREEALQYDPDAIAAFERIGIKGGVANVYCNLSDKLLDLGRLEEAKHAAEAALAIAESIGHRVWTAGALGGIGAAHLKQGNYDEAASSCEPSAAIYEEIGDAQHIEWIEGVLAELRAAQLSATLRERARGDGGDLRAHVGPAPPRRRCESRPRHDLAG
jgi:tetratricopeptide (TPR) repeat protein